MECRAKNDPPVTNIRLWAFWGCRSALGKGSGREKKPFFEYNKRLLRQKTGGACLYMPQDGHWLASIEVIPPPPPKKVSFPAANKMKIPHWKLFSWSNFFLKILAFSVFAAKILSRRSRLSRWSGAPSRLIRPRPIDCDGGHDRQTMISRFFEEKKH